MKSYPSIKQFRADRHGEFAGHTFAKLDGSNLRFEWDRKKGWFRFGSRRRLLTKDHPVFGKAMQMFVDEFADRFERYAHNEQHSSIIVFCEFWGDRSFAGEHEDDDQHRLTPIDVAIHKKGLLSVNEFLEQFESDFNLAYIGKTRWDEEFVAKVQGSSLPGMAFEGVVGKAGAGHKRIAIKLKSNAWKDKVLSRYGQDRGRKIIDS